jgi:hypothetical protein
LSARQVGLTAEIRDIAWKAQERLHTRYRRLLGRGVSKPKAITAIARELLGFIWAIGMQVEREAAAAVPKKKAA